jgi:ATP-dependent DNA helicase RecG
VTTQKIIDLVRQDKFITISEMARRIGVSTRAVEKQLAKLKEQNMVERVGSDKGGYWELNP